MNIASDVSTESSNFVELARRLVERAGVKPKPGGEKAFTDALLAQMRADKLLAVAILPDHGGPGLSLADTARITFEIPKQDSSAGLIYAIHMSEIVDRRGRLVYGGEGEIRFGLDRGQTKRAVLGRAI